MIDQFFAAYDLISPTMIGSLWAILIILVYWSHYAKFML